MPMTEQKRKRGRPRLDTHLTSVYGSSRRQAVNSMYMFEAVGALTEAASKIPDRGLLWTVDLEARKAVSKDGILEQLGRMLIQDGFTSDDFIYTANLAADATNAGYTAREVEKAIRAIRLAYKAIDLNQPDPYKESIANRARAELQQMAAYGHEQEGAAND